MLALWDFDLACTHLKDRNDMHWVNPRWFLTWWCVTRHREDDNADNEWSRDAITVRHRYRWVHDDITSTTWPRRHQLKFCSSRSLISGWLSHSNRNVKRNEKWELHIKLFSLSLSHQWVIIGYTTNILNNVQRHVAMGAGLRCVSRARDPTN